MLFRPFDINMINVFQSVKIQRYALRKNHVPNYLSQLLRFG